MNNNKGAMVFSWILVLIIGAMIIVLAIVFATKMGKVEQEKQDVIVIEYFDILFNPFTSVGAITESYGKGIELPYEIKVNFTCVNEQERLIVGERAKKIENIVYASDLKTRKLSIYTKPFELPFRVTDLIYAFDSSQEFCLIYNSDSEALVYDIKEDIENNLDDVRIEVYLRDDCSEDSRIISFNPLYPGDVNIDIIGQERFVYGEIFFENEYEKSIFIGRPLIEAAIFSNQEIYDCNLERIKEKFSNVADIYIKKTSFLETLSCPYALIRDLENMKGYVSNLDSENTRMLSIAAQKFEIANRALACTQVY